MFSHTYPFNRRPKCAISTPIYGHRRPLGCQVLVLFVWLVRQSASPPILVSPISNFVLFDLLKFALLLLTIRSLITTVAAASGAAEFCTTAYSAYITMFIVVDILVIRILFIWLSFIDL